MNRWLLVLSRVGTVLVAVGLALLLVSLIPPATLNSFAGTDQVASDTFQQLGPRLDPFANANFSFYTQFFSTLTPQQELKVELTCNGTVEVYLLEMSMLSLMDQFPGNERNVTALKTFLQTNPELIGWQGEIIEGTVDYIPTQVINATLILSNPSSNSIVVDYNGSILSLLAPAEKVRTLAFFAVPVGFVLALPWLSDLWKSRAASKTQLTLRNTA